MTARIIKAGPLTTVQDRGRAGYREFGVSVGGAADPFSARVANTLVGNGEDAAVIEITMGGLRLTLADERAVAWCGGQFRVTIADVVVPAGRACRCLPGAEVRADLEGAGCRAWLAISGGIDAAFILGSRATDLRGGFGGLDGRALRDGDALPLCEINDAAGRLWARLPVDRAASFGAPPEWAQPFSRPEILRVAVGSDRDRFSAPAWETFLATEFSVSMEADRMGARLDGPVLERIDDGGDLVSEAVVPGTVQIPPNGKPILLLADAQTIGGYPKLAHAIAVDLPRAAQLRPNDRIRFAEASLGEAHRLWIEREKSWRRFQLGLSLHS
ncbi:MAG: biotin-dependent carboxyltransferase family protein [Chthoniobacteraceae bacterium]